MIEQIIAALFDVIVGILLALAGWHHASADLYAENEHLKRQLPRRGPRGRFVKRGWKS